MRWWWGRGLTALPADPFADASKGDDLLPAGTEDYIHIRIQQRNGRKTLTTVQGIADDYDKKKLVKAFKKVGLRAWEGSSHAQQRCLYGAKAVFCVFGAEICLQWYCN